MEIEDTTSKKDKPESYNDTEVEERLKDIDEDSFIAYFSENGRMIEQQEMGGEQCSADKCSFDSWRKRVLAEQLAEPVELHRQPDPQGGSQTKKGTAIQAAERVDFAEVANIFRPGRQASEDEVKSAVQMRVRR